MTTKSKYQRTARWVSGLLATCALLGGCAKKESKHGPAAGAAAHSHAHVAPHGGTPVVLGHEAFHLELVVDAASGVMQAYVLDGEMENFVRIKEPALVVEARVGGATQVLELRAAANPATGETVGDTAQFEGQADWLKTTKEFDATLKTIAIRGTTFRDVRFNFPKGNESSSH